MMIKAGHNLSYLLDTACGDVSTSCAAPLNSHFTTELPLLHIKESTLAQSSHQCHTRGCEHNSLLEQLCQHHILRVAATSGQVATNVDNLLPKAETQPAPILGVYLAPNAPVALAGAGCDVHTEQPHCCLGHEGELLGCVLLPEEASQLRCWHMHNIPLLTSTAPSPSCSLSSASPLLPAAAAAAAVSGFLRLMLKLGMNDCAAAACNIVLLVLVNLENEKRSDQPCWTCSADTAHADR
jgi:hypothetical protein